MARLSYWENPGVVHKSRVHGASATWAPTGVSSPAPSERDHTRDNEANETSTTVWDDIRGFLFLLYPPTVQITGERGHVSDQYVQTGIGRTFSVALSLSMSAASSIFLRRRALELWESSTVIIILA